MAAILVLNCGSSTIKFQLLDMPSGTPLLKGSVKKIGQKEGKGRIHYDASLEHWFRRFSFYQRESPAIKENLLFLEEPLSAISYANAFDWIFAHFPSTLSLDAIGHRVVHGGPYFNQTVKITQEVLELIEACSSLAPLHNPIQLEGIRLCQTYHGEIPQFASFDTAFHRDKPEVHRIFSLPHGLCTQFGYEKSGFHGASHRYVARRAATMLQRPLEELRLISCHLGGGSSITAIHQGKALDTTATYGTCGGMPMGTRSGDIDTAVILDLILHRGYTPQEVSDILYTQSGLLGISGVSSDMAELERLEQTGHAGAHRAREYYVYMIKKFIGAFVALLEGVDGIIFTGGIGEKDHDIRARVCQSLGWLGAHIDLTKNRSPNGETLISSADSRVALLVIPTDEELEIAWEVAEALAQG
ncbi:MAG: acetate/propionate family kinase [Treponemataceae bacterium]|nr:acetate/propionate family kinase [Treponemataceae bacterium]